MHLARPPPYFLTPLPFLNGIKLERAQQPASDANDRSQMNQGARARRRMFGAWFRLVLGVGMKRTHHVLGGEAMSIKSARAQMSGTLIRLLHICS